ncbi:hypothetical protein K474DRAFT_1661295 [Panus rudis PR-1116 ss-1]|nr:hypothetical protein K474DRAFT_1661295 [Panus rudis PR-1116 ss-1]
MRQSESTRSPPEVSQTRKSLGHPWDALSGPQDSANRRRPRILFISDFYAILPGFVVISKTVRPNLKYH